MSESPASMASWIDQPPPNYRMFPVGDGYAYLHETCKISARLTIGRFSYINAGAVLGGKYPIRIGAFCSIAAELYAWTWESHQTDYVTTSPLRLILGVQTSYPVIVDKPQGITLGNDVYLGHQVRLMPGVSIGDGAVVAARAVVTHDLEPYGIYGGVPARLIRKRFADPVVSALLNVRWWDWPIQKIQRNTAFFDLKLSELKTADSLYATIVE
ncbi:CatB-related O-acetyltransferase [Thiorhodococcus fuscus]|uniref:CatB-related O-acetyltransferase n=1 Tax=Thiorhodococcus fuscus TaxID=527200 RepID=A0ABW4YC19_9GAMM